MKPAALRVAIVGYRDWAKRLYDLVDLGGQQWPRDVVQLSYLPGHPADPTSWDLVFFVGWSHIVPPEVYTKVPCLVLHPSPLPHYRGGSPIQHQIMNGETQSAVTLFRLDARYPAVDAGPIVWQMGYSLEGSLSGILERIAMVGARGVIDVISTLLKHGAIIDWAQHQEGYEVFKRRTPAQSEIFVQDFRDFTALQLHNKVRALQDPYPLPFVTCADGRRLYLLETRLESEDAFIRRRLEHPTDPYFVSGRATQPQPPTEEEVERGMAPDALTSERAPSSEFEHIFDAFFSMGKRSKE